MVVALATLPLYSWLTREADVVFTGTELGVSAAEDFPFAANDLAFDLAGAAASFFVEDGFAADLAAGFATAFLLETGFAAAFADAGFFTTVADFFAAGLVTACVLAGFFAAAGFEFDLPVAFFAAGFALAAVDFFASALLPDVFFAAGAAVFLTAGFAALAALLLTLFTARPFGAATLELTALASFALVADLPFCAFEAVELRVVFAISLHRCWPWRPGVIAHVSCTSKHTSGILVPLHAANCSSSVKSVTYLILWLLRLYKRWLSPLLGSNCRFYPSCSDYARTAVTRFGPWRGGLLSGWRLLRCQPLCTGGNDPVPDHFHYPRCRCREASTDKQ